MQESRGAGWGLGRTSTRVAAVAHVERVQTEQNGGRGHDERNRAVQHEPVCQNVSLPHRGAITRQRTSAVVALALGVIISAAYVRPAKAAHTYWDCLEAASYGLSQCMTWALLPDATFTSADCWETFFYLRDDENGCHQFDPE